MDTDAPAPRQPLRAAAPSSPAAGWAASGGPTTSLLNRPVAVKVLRSEFTGDPAFLARFRAEAQHAALAAPPQHRRRSSTTASSRSDGEHLAYLVMELVEGESLAALLARERRLDVGAQPRHPAAHRRRAGRGARGGRRAPRRQAGQRPGRPGRRRQDHRLRDRLVGVQRAAHPDRPGHRHRALPLPGAGRRAARPRPASDVYALGAVAYECLAGRRPFEGENSVQIAVMQIRDEPDPLPADVPADVRALVERAMAKDPAERFPDGAAASRRGGPPSAAHRSGRPARPSPGRPPSGRPQRWGGPAPR